MMMARETDIAVLPRHRPSLDETLLSFAVLARSARYKQIVTLWLGVFCAAFSVLPGEWEQRWLFYLGIPLALPAVADAWRRLAGGLLFWSLAGFLAYSGVSALWSDNWLSAGDELRRAFWIGYFLLICCAVGDQGAGAWRQLLRGVQIFAAVWAVVQVVDFALSCVDCARFTGYGPHANANYTASTAGAMAVLGLASVLSEPRRKWRWLLASQGPLLALLFATGGRAALIGYAATLLLGVALVTLRAGIARAGLAIGATIGGIVAVALAARAFAGDWTAAELGRGDTFRLEIWAATIARIMQRPWFGHGSTALDQFAVNGTVVGYHSHNLFLAQAFYGGVAGLALWLAVFVLAARAAVRAWRTQGDVLPASGVFFLLVVGMVDVGYVVVDVQAIWFYVWLVLGITLSYDVSARRPMPRRPLTTAA